MNEKALHKKSIYLIALCWLAYTCSYIGKLSYNANISQFINAYQVSKADAGMISSFFFFAYGAGQIVNGFMCKKYNIRYVIFAALLVASLMNVLVVIVPDFSIIKFLWLINGIAMSFLWTSLIRLLSETLKKEYLNKAIIAMGTTVATGTFIVYGISSILAVFQAFRITFYIAAALMTAVSLLWFFAFNRLVKPLRAECEMEEQTENSQVQTSQKRANGFIILVIVLAFFAVANNFIKDGLTAWTPNILKQLYQTPDWLSILLTLLLPVMAIGGSVVAVNVHKRTKHYVGTCAILYVGSALLIGMVLGFISTPALPVTVACLALVSCLMAGVNNVITSLVPLHLKTQMNAGKLAGILNGFCYLGSTISTYGLGAIADAFGWLAVFITLLAVCCVVIVIGLIYIVINRKNAKK